MTSGFAAMIQNCQLTYRQYGLVLSIVLLPACGGGATDSPPEARDTVALRGADISALERIEQGGGVFRDGAQAGDGIAILRAHGSNLFRLRLFVSPSGAEVEVNDLPYTIGLAQRVKAAGATLLLDIHYSDTWADPGHQATPAVWAGLDSVALELQVESYTADVITQLKQAGALPDIVQVGNEVDDGMLWPLGRLSGAAADSAGRWGRFTRLLQAGIRGVRGALAPSDSVRIMLHYSQGGSYGGTQWFFDHIDAYGVPYDLIGLSYYPWWHGTLNGLQVNLQATALRYGRDVMVVETSYPWRAGGWESMAINRAAMTWPISPAGQASFLRDLVKVVATVPNGRGVGVVWWYPEAIQVPGLFIWGGGSMALFDAGGSLLPAASEFDADAAGPEAEALWANGDRAVEQLRGNDKFRNRAGGEQQLSGAEQLSPCTRVSLKLNRTAAKQVSGDDELADHPRVHHAQSLVDSRPDGLDLHRESVVVGHFDTHRCWGRLHLAGLSVRAR